MTAGRAPFHSLVLAQDFPWPTGSGSMLRLDAVVRALARLGPVDLLSTVERSRALPTELPASAPVARSEVAFYTRRPLGLARKARCLVSGEPLEVAARREPGLPTVLQRWARPAYDFVWVSKGTTFEIFGRPRLGPTAVDLDDLEDQKIRARVQSPAFAEQYPEGAAGRVHSHLARLQAYVDAARWASLQRRIASAVAAVVLCSELDTQRMGVANAVIVPNGYQPPGRPVGRQEVSAQPTVLFQGLLSYAPNTDAARWLAEDIAPRLQQLNPAAQVRLVGEVRPAQRRLHSPPLVTVTDRVPDIVPELERADVVAVPIRFGSGTRVKILEAFAHRIPVVSTTLGAEGLGARDGEHLLLADTAADFAAACARLLVDTALRGRLAANAQRLFLDRYTWALAEEVILGLAGGHHPPGEGPAASPAGAETGHPARRS